MKKVTKGTDYKVLTKMANEFGIKHVGVKKEVLVESINNKIDEIEAAKSLETSENLVITEKTEVNENTEVNETSEINQTNEVSESTETPAAAEKPEVKKGKWYEQKDAFPYAEGQIVIISDHPNKSIINRMVEVVGPSSKRNAIKGYLLSDKTGLRQKTCLSLDFQMITEYTPEYPVVTPEVI